MQLFTACSKEDKTKSDVKTFIEQVQNNKYLESNLPNFTPDAIPILLERANDFREIENFPVNPASSHGFSKKTIGECLLWTIEHIRLHYGNYNNGYQFPSLIPVLFNSSDELHYDLSISQLTEAVKLYSVWWNANTNTNFEELRLINPLVSSSFKWR